MGRLASPLLQKEADEVLSRGQIAGHRGVERGEAPVLLRQVAGMLRLF